MSKLRTNCAAQDRSFLVGLSNIAYASMLVLLDYVTTTVCGSRDVTFTMLWHLISSCNSVDCIFWYTTFYEWICANEIEFHKLIWFVSCLVMSAVAVTAAGMLLCILSMLIFMRLALIFNLSDPEAVIKHSTS